MSKTPNPIFQNPLSRRGKTRGAKDGKLVQLEDSNITVNYSERCSTPASEESVLESTLEMETTPIIPVYGRGRKKLIRDRGIATTHTRTGN